MLTLFPELTDELRASAIPLDSIGVIGGYAWSIDDTFNVLNLLRKSYPNLIVLGGDVLINDDSGNLNYIYAFWSYDKKESDKGKDASESSNVAEQYLKRFDEHTDRAKLYVDLVVDNDQLEGLAK